MSIRSRGSCLKMFDCLLDHAGESGDFLIGQLGQRPAAFARNNRMVKQRPRLFRGCSGRPGEAAAQFPWIVVSHWRFRSPHSTDLKMQFLLRRYKHHTVARRSDEKQSSRAYSSALPWTLLTLRPGDGERGVATNGTGPQPLCGIQVDVPIR